MPIVLAQAGPPAAIAPAPPVPPAAVMPAAVRGPIADPFWESVKATRAEMQTYYPAAALADAASGVAIIECVVTPKGTLDPCKALREEPQGYQFGDAAVKLAARFRMKTTTRSGASAIGRVVRMPIEFNFAWSMFEPISSRPTFDVLASPTWAKRPTSRDLERAYPEGALQTHMQGDVLVRCQVQVDGQLAECAIDREEPSDYRFGDAALRLISQLQVDMRRGPGLKAAGKWITVPVNFRLAW
jgi:TonB family protein